MTRHDVLTLLNEVGLGEYADAAYHLLQPALRLTTEPAASDDDLSVGASKMGGWPDLPPSTSWPHWKGEDGTWEPSRPLHFLAQINLADAHAAIEQGYGLHPELALLRHQLPLDFGAPVPRVAPPLPHMPLPPSGLLSVFYDADDQPGDGNAGGFRVLYSPEVERLERCVVPNVLHALDENSLTVFRSCSLRFSLVTPSQPLRRLLFNQSEEVRLNDQEKDLLENALERIEEGGSPFGGNHQLLGLADYIQHDPMPQWARDEMETDGVDLDDEAGSLVWKAVASRAREWTLLLQIDSDTNINRLGWTWGDEGMLYFHIRKADLAAGDFSRVRLELQHC